MSELFQAHAIAERRIHLVVWSLRQGQGLLMGRYRKKPVVIDAIQFTGTNWVEVRDFFGRGTHIWADPDGTLVIPTLEGDMKASPSDWVIKGVKGELYPCKPDIFEATYEAEDAGKIVIADNDESEGDWEGFYLDGKLVTQGHSHTPQMVLEALGIPFERRDESHYLEENGHFPDLLSELKGAQP